MRRSLREGGIPTHLYPEDAAKALGRVMHHVRWRAQPEEPPADFPDARSDEAAAVIAEALTEDRAWLAIADRARLLDCYGIAFPAWEPADDPAAAGAAAARIGGRVAVKAEGPAIVHKTEVGAVRVGLAGAEEVEAAAAEIDEGLQRAGIERESFMVQAMAEDGVELLTGVVADPVFGPVLACGAGGIYAELLKDVAVRICPITRADAAEMIRSLAVFPLLTGFRGLTRGRPRRARGTAGSTQCDGRCASGDRRGRAQPGDRQPQRGNRRGRQGPRRGCQPHALMAANMGLGC